MLTWSSWLALPGIESITLGIDSSLFSLAIADALQ